MKKLSGSIALTMIFALAAFADVRLPDTPKPTPAPKQTKSIDTQLHISISKDAKEARLVIPKSQIKQLRAELEELDDSDATAAVNFSRVQTVVSGLFLSLAFCFGGVWLVRSRKTIGKTSKTVVVGAGLFLSGALATITFANIAPPSVERKLTGNIFSDSVRRNKQAFGRVKLATSNETDRIELIVPDVKNEGRTGEEE